MNDRRFYSVNKGKSSFARYFLGAVIMTALIFFAIPLSQLLDDVVRQQLPAEVVEYLDTIVLPYYFKIFEQEEEKEVIERTLEALRELADCFGPAAFANCLPNVVSLAFGLCRCFFKDGS